MLKSLQNIGLSEKEAKVYLAMLELGKATVQEIGKKAEVNRATTYVQLETLKARGLVSQIMEGKKTFFMPEAPGGVQRMVEKEKVDILYKEKEAKKLLPDLEAIYDLAQKRPNVRFYEGQAGVDAYSEYLVQNPPKRRHIIYPVLDVDTFNNSPADEIEASINKELHKVKDYKAIYSSSERLPLITKMSKENSNFQVRWIPRKKLELSTEIIITDNEVWMINLVGKYIGVAIEDKLITESFESIFKLLWQMAK